MSVAYRPAGGAAAGRDFYDVFALSGGRTGLILGDVSAPGNDALARTTFVRYTLRAHIEAGLAPREVLKVASDTLAAHLDGGFARVTLALYDPASGRFTYASAGHPPPVVAGGGEPFEPVVACSAPPLGIGEPTGFRQSTFTLTAGARACLYTDGVCLAAAAAEDAPATGTRIEEIEVDDEHEVGDSLERFLRACGVALADVPGVLRAAGEAARREGSVTVRVRVNDFRPGIDVVPGNVVHLAERRRALG